MSDARPWVVDTSTFTHLFRSGFGHLLNDLAPGGILLMPPDVVAEVERGRDTYADIPDVNELRWVDLAIPTDAEILTQVQINVALGGGGVRHLGESAVIAVAHHRDLVALLDDQAAVEQANLMQVSHHSTLWVVIEAYRTIFGLDRRKAEVVVDGLIDTGMYLPIKNGSSLFAWAYEEELLP